MYDEIIQGNVSENKINIIIDKASDYEDFIKEIYAYMKIKYQIPEIEWLMKI